MWWYNTILIWHYSSTVYRYKYKYTYYRWVKTLNIIGGEGGRKQNNTVCVTIQDMIGTTLDLIRNHDQESKLSKASSVKLWGCRVGLIFSEAHGLPRHKKTLIKWIRRWFLLSYCHGKLWLLWSLNLQSYRYGLTQNSILGIGKEEGCICIYIYISTYISYFFVSHEPHTLVHRNHFRHFRLAHFQSAFVVGFWGASPKH